MLSYYSGLFSETAKNLYLKKKKSNVNKYHQHRPGYEVENIKLTYIKISTMFYL